MMIALSWTQNHLIYYLKRWSGTFTKFSIQTDFPLLTDLRNLSAVKPHPVPSAKSLILLCSYNLKLFLLCHHIMTLSSCDRGWKWTKSTSVQLLLMLSKFSWWFTMTMVHILHHSKDNSLTLHYFCITPFSNSNSNLVHFMQNVSLDYF